MKFKTTKKEVNEGYSCVLKVGYCELQDLLHYQNPIAYTCGVYGWNADIYNAPEPRWGGTAIVTGYRPFGFQIPHELCVAYNKKACEILNSQLYDYDKTREQLNTLIWSLISKCRTLYIERMFKK